MFAQMQPSVGPVGTQALSRARHRRGGRQRSRQRYGWPAVVAGSPQRRHTSIMSFSAGTTP